MKSVKQKIVLFIFFFISVISFSQKSGIKGLVTDEFNVPLETVSVAILNPKDSIFLNYTTTDIKGVFYLSDIPKDSILIQFNLLGFSPYSKKLIYRNKFINLNTIILKESVSNLDEIVIAAIVPIQIKKDTISFNASSFKVNHDDNIEALLGKLPGIEIEEGGKVVTQGTTVTKIMIDGKEFFGGDPAIVLKNISADAISKVEIIDKKSDEAELTGVNDGAKEIVINLTLKKSKKNKGFGGVSTGIGLDNRYFGNVNYNQFNAKTQVSIIGKFNNINITGSNIQGFLENADGIGDDNSDDDFSENQRSLSGFLETQVAGVHYGKEIKKKESLNVDYFYNFSENNGISETSRLTFTNNNNFNYTSENNFLNTTKNHNFNFNYNNKSNKTNSLRIRGRFFSNHRNANLVRDGSFFNSQEELFTENNSVSTNTDLRRFGNVNLDYYRRLLKKGRSFNIGFDTKFNDFNKSNHQTALINRNLNRTNPSTQELVTFRAQDISSTSFTFRLKYKEPLGGNHYLNTAVNSTFLSEKERTNQSRKITRATTVEDLIEFDFNYLENSLKSSLFHSYNTSTLNIKTTVELQNLRREFGQINSAEFIKDNVYINPLFSFQYVPQTGKKFQFSYKRFIKTPKPSQINPFINDLNPFFIRTGNVDLRVEKVNSLLTFLNISNLKSSISFNTELKYNYSTDAIISSITIDEDFIRKSSFQNNGERHNFNAQASLSKKLNKLGVRFNLKNQFAYNAVNSIVNTNLNKLVSEDFSTNFTVQNIRKRKIDLKSGFFYSFNTTNLSIDQNLNRKYTTQKYFGMIDFDASENFNVNMQLDYVIYRDNVLNIQQELPILNTAISYALSKNNNIFKLVFIDLLNRNIDIFRRSTVNFFEETTSQSLGRYIILSYTYKLKSGNNTKS